MKKSSFMKAMTSVVAVLTFQTITSCVDEKYELSDDNIHTNVTVFQNGISIPLGSTGQITLGSLYDQLGEDAEQMLQEFDGAYMFRVADTLDVTADLADALSGLGALDAMSISEEFSFSLNSIDLSEIKIEGKPISTSEIDLAELLDNIDVDEFSSRLPVLSKEMNTIEFSVPKLEKDALSIDITSHLSDELTETTEIASLEDIITLPESVLTLPLADEPMGYDQIKTAFPALGLPDLNTSFEFHPYTVNIPIELTLPKEIKEVKSIEIHEDASFELVFKVLNPLFTEGSIVPELDIDLHNLLHISSVSDGAIIDDVNNNGHFEQHVKDRFVMSSSNGWTSDHVYKVDRLAFDKDWTRNEDGCLVLKKNIPVTMSGTLKEDGLKTTLKHLVKNGKEAMQIQMEVKFNNIEIDDVQLEINTIVPEIEPVEIPVEVDAIDMGADLIKKVDLEFDPSSPLNVFMKADLPEMFEGLDIKLRNLKIRFPEGMVVNASNSIGSYDAASGTLTYTDRSLADGLNDNVVIESLSLDDIKDGKLSYSGKVTVTAEAAAEGIVSSKKLLSSDYDNVTIDARVSYEPKLNDFAIVIDDCISDVSFDPVEINEPLDEDIAELLLDKPVVVSLKKDDAGRKPVISIDLVYPQDPAIKICGKKGEGLTIDFPDMFRFASASIKDSYNFNADGNVMTFTENDQIPDIELEIESIAVQAKKKDGAYFISDRMEVKGGVRLESTTIRKADIERLQQNEVKVISVRGNIPDIEPSGLGLDEFEKSFEEKISIGKIETEIPDMINSLSVQDILLKDVYFDLEVDAASIKKLIPDAKISVSLEVGLPEMFLIECEGEDGTVDKNVLRISGHLGSDGKIVFDGIHVIGLNLSGLNVADGKLSLDVGDILVKGSVRIENLTVDMNDFAGKEFDIRINGGLASRGDDGKPGNSILFDKINGYVDLSIDPIETSVDLSSFAETMNGENMSLVLDVNTFYLTLDINTNIDIPLKGSLEVTPYFGGVPGQTRNPAITLDPQKRKDDSYNIFISNINPNSPGEGSGYDGRYDIYKDYQCVELDLISMLYKNVEGQKPVVADSLKISVNAGVDSKTLCTVEPNKDYKLSSKFELGVPLELGDKFEFEYRTVIDDLSETAAKMFEYGSVGLSGKITNGFPLSLNLQVRPLDSNGNAIPLKEEVGILNISSCDAKGNPVTSDINFVLSGKGADLSDMKAIEIVFKADAKAAAGVPFNKDSFIQLSLNALLPDGVTLDVKELGLLEGQENQN